MILQQKLDEFKAQFESRGPPRKAPKAVIELFHRATEELRQSGLAERRSVLRQLFLTGQAVRPLPRHSEFVRLDRFYEKARAQPQGLKPSISYGVWRHG